MLAGWTEPFTSMTIVRSKCCSPRLPCFLLALSTTSSLLLGGFILGLLRFCPSLTTGVAGLNELMRLSARILNLKEHGVVSSKGGPKRLASALDLEVSLLAPLRTMPSPLSIARPAFGVPNCCMYLQGHKGKDGRYYLLDFSRTMPPVEPAHGVKNGYLYQLLRPEVSCHLSPLLRTRALPSRAPAFVYYYIL
jgi:hypothetical protein